MSEEPLNIISLGAGVQSTTMALMAEKGELSPKVDCAIFADTGAEPHGVYEHLDWLESQLSFPVHRVMEKEGLTQNLLQSAEDKTSRAANAPFYTLNESGKKEGKLLRICTSEFKIRPLMIKVRELLGLKKGQKGGKEVRVYQWIGISFDEIQRMKESKVKWSEHRWPLIELKMTRQDCLDWMKKNGYPEPPRSACTYCPYHSDAFWTDMRDNYPKSWSEAIEMDRAVREGIRGTTTKLFVHRSCVPLDEVNFKTTSENNQEFINFQEDCEGMFGN